MGGRGRLFIAGAFAWFCACTYDWPSGALRDAGPDAPVDGSVDDRTSPPDAPADSPADRGADVGPDTAPNCAALKAEVVATRAKAKACPAISQFCYPTVKDECGCLSYVLDAGTSEDTQYATAVQVLTDSKCPFNCPQPCPSLPVAGTCVIVDAGPIQCSP